MLLVGMRRRSWKWTIVREMRGLLIYAFGIDDFYAGRDPDSRPPTNSFQRVMHYISAVYRWMETPEAIVRFILAELAIDSLILQFAFKYIFISIALWIPCVVRSSACMSGSLHIFVLPLTFEFL